MFNTGFVDDYDGIPNEAAQESEGNEDGSSENQVMLHTCLN